MAAKQSAIVKKQLSTAGLIERTIENAKKKGLVNLTLPVLRGRQQTLQDLWQKFQQQHEEILELEKCEEADEYLANLIFDNVFEEFQNANDFFCTMIAETSVTDANNLTSNSPSFNPNNLNNENLFTNFRLPNITIPKFSGRYEDWENFKDLFESLVDKDTRLDNVQKLHYLKSNLTGEASLLLKHIPVSEANYRMAWDLIKKRYGNICLLVYSYLQKFFDIPVIQKQSVLSDLKSLRDVILDIRLALINLNRPVEHWDDIFIFFVTKKFDTETLREWGVKRGANVELPTFNELEEFLDTRIRVLETVCTRLTPLETEIATSSKTIKTNVKAHNTNIKSRACIRCKGEHPLYLCNQFKKDEIDTRRSFVQKERVCFNCLKKGHTVVECISKFTCTFCNKKHHSLLHPINSSKISNTSSEESTCDKINTVSSTVSTMVTCNLLPTALIKLHANSGRFITVRALLDQGSQISCVSERVQKMLRLRTKRVSVNLNGVGGTKMDAVNKSVSLTMSPVDTNQPRILFHALVLPSITSYTLSVEPSALHWPILASKTLADPQARDKGEIDCLLGVSEFSQIMLDGILRDNQKGILAQETIFGWVISGRNSSLRPDSLPQLINHVSISSIDDDIRKFWELEEVPPPPLYTPEEQECENHFLATHRRDKSGRYVVALPFKQGQPPACFDTFRDARACFLHNEKRLSRSPSLHHEYENFMQEYLNLKHMQECKDDALIAQSIFIPHLPVIRTESKTTKIRIVFNASYQYRQGFSLNDFLHTGPKLQADLFTLMVRWRCHQFVYVADIAKMFRQILIEPTDTRYQSILWRTDPTAELKAYNLLTVTYGTACAPYLANRVLLQLANDEGENFPLGASVLRNSFYVDDALFGADDKAQLLGMRDELIQLLRAGGFTLRKWASNEPSLVVDISEKDHGLALSKTFSLDERMKVLGICWNPKQDSFIYACTVPEFTKCTKRTFLSLVSSIYDPMGWTAPFLICGKILIQLLWLLKLDWDDPLPKEIATRCEAFHKQLNSLGELKFERWLGIKNDSKCIEIHGFSDASKVAYAAVVYLRVVTADNHVIVTLVYAKTKVAPLKVISIPRLELCATVLLTRAIRFVQNALQKNTLPVFCWTDSKTVLDWLKRPPNTLKTFEANRVSHVQTTLEHATWRHVPSNSNPADCASRGLDVHELQSCSQWWQGPTWLQDSPEKWPSTVGDCVSFETDLSVTTLTPVSLETEWPIVTRCSSWNKLIRSFAYALRFLSITNRSFKQRALLSCIIDEADSNPSLQGSLSALELKHSEITLIRLSQEEHFSKEMHLLKKGLPIPSKSSLLSLSPFLDNDGLLRVGGRLALTDLSETRKHPLVIPKGRVAELLVRHFHLSTLHGGMQLTLRALRSQYWVISARSMTRTVVNRCVICCRMRATMQQQIMSDLPSSRLNHCRAFEHVGVDYAGPFALRLASGRGRHTQKGYVALFVCMSVRAVHLEVVTDYTAKAFLAAFDRFVSRRGLPVRVYSDNGTNFRGAARELANQFQGVMTDPLVKDRLANDRVHWSFNPPHAPHFGGLWEAGVKSVKFHLKRVLGDFTPTYEEFQTLLCKIEAVLNSRPLVPLHDNVDNCDAITPGHFLVGTALSTPPNPSLLDRHTRYVSRWQALQAMYERFWNIWSADFLNSLQMKVKWKTTREDIKVGDIVLIRDQNAPPTKWLLGKIIEVFYSLDRHVRRVKLRTANSVFERPIAQLCKLPTQEK